MFIFKWISFAAILVIFSTTQAQDTIPDGWIKAGSTPKAYTVGLDEKIKFRKKKSAFLSSDRSKDFGTLMQTFVAREYLGEKIRLIGYLKTEDVKGWAGLWLRVDSKEGKKVLSFDNMQDRPIEGTTDWTAYEIILEVPKESGWISYGGILNGNGKVWIDEFSIEIVDSSTKTTEKDHQRPYNTDFEY